MKRRAAQAVTFILRPISKETPMRNSEVLNKIDNGIEIDPSQVRWNISKYSENLMAEPIGSTPFTKPLKMNKNPTKILLIIRKYFMFENFNKQAVVVRLKVRYNFKISYSL
jgi:hypothetical protein